VKQVFIPKISPGLLLSWPYTLNKALALAASPFAHAVLSDGMRHVRLHVTSRSGIERVFHVGHNEIDAVGDRAGGGGGGKHVGGQVLARLVACQQLRSLIRRQEPVLDLNG
jgi:hypothetical protein